MVIKISKVLIIVDVVSVWCYYLFIYFNITNDLKFTTFIFDVKNYADKYTVKQKLFMDIFSTSLKNVGNRINISMYIYGNLISVENI